MVADIFPESPILITLPRILKNEAETLAALCGAGVSVIHIRKPEASEPEIEELLKTLQALGADMSRLTIHYNEPLARKYGLGGVHRRTACRSRRRAAAKLFGARLDGSGTRGDRRGLRISEPAVRFDLEAGLPQRD